MKKQYLIKPTNKININYNFLVITVICTMIVIAASFYKGFVILTGSMTPNIKEDSVIIVKDIEFDSIKKGDIITFRTSEIITHRVVDILQDNDGKVYLQTKGDANNRNDDFKIYENDMIGKVVFVIPYIGKVIRYIKSLQFIFTFLLVLILLDIYKFFLTTK